jgi:outer membrane protein insertion porin family/translocation and assembly module TamA
MRTGLVALCVSIVAGILPAAAQERDAGVQRLAALTFRGNEALSDGALEQSIETSAPPFLAGVPVLGMFASRPPFDPDAVRRDLVRLTALYRVRGFPRASVDTIVARHDGLVDLTFVITEGPPERIASLSFAGLADVVSRSHLLAEIPIAQGEPLDELALERAVTVVEAQVRDRGFPFPTVSASVRRDSSRREADVLVRVDRGPRGVIDSIAVAGTQEIDHRVVLQTITVQPGDPFSAQALYDSELALYRSGLFEYASVALADSAPARRDTAVAVVVGVDLVEGPPQRVRVGGGYGTMDCFRALASTDLNNLLGGGRILELRASASKIGVGDPLGGLDGSFPCRAFRDEDSSRLKLNYRVSATVRDPLLFARRTEGSVAVYAERYTEFRAYLRQSVGGRVSLTRRLGRSALPVTLGYALSRGRTVADPVTLCQYFSTCEVRDTEFFAESRRRSVLSLSFVWDRTNALIGATTGSAFSSEVHWASGIIGSDSLIQFARGIAEYAWYRRLSGRAVLAWRMRIGAVLSPTLGFESGERRYTPPEDRFYLGGPNTVRGFAQNRLGPVVYVLDAVEGSAEAPDSVLRTSAAGGNLLGLANVELRLPLPGGDRFRGVAFVDAGFIAERFGEIGKRFRLTPGAGVRIRTPVGAVRLDVGYNPYPSEEGPLFEQVAESLVQVREAYRPARSWIDHFRLHFSIGQAF